MSEIDALIQRWKEGDERAAEIIYNQYCHQMFDFACLILNNELDAEEAAQDALFNALRHINQYNRKKAKFITWLRQITLNRCRKKYPSRLKQSITWLTNWFESGGDVPDTALRPESQVIKQEKDDEVWNAIQTLSPLLRETVILRYYNNCTIKEIAYTQDCKLRTAQSRIRLGLKQLKKTLNGKNPNYLLEEEDILR